MLKELLKKHRSIGLRDDPEFNKSRRFHDWRNYIPDELREVWGDMSYDARIAAYVIAEHQAGLENYD